MIRKHLSIFFLTLFIQTVIYPAVIFHCYVEVLPAQESRSLPIDFPDNGNACYFGLNNNEEESQNENPCPILEESFHNTQFSYLTSWVSAGFGLILDHKTTHLEIATPPPEVV